MKEINWKKIAEEHDLTPQQLEEQILIAACCMCDMRISSQQEIIKFTCSQPNYKLELSVRQINR